MNTASYYNTRLRKFALGRLELITARRFEKVKEIAYLQELGALVGTEEASYTFQLHLLDRAIYSIYLDCIDAGAEDEARHLLDGLRRLFRTPRLRSDNRGKKEATRCTPLL